MLLMRLRYGGSAARWGFAIYLASRDGYEDSVLLTGDLASAPALARPVIGVCGVLLLLDSGHAAKLHDEP